jgi:hypothetical protein
VNFLRALAGEYGLTLPVIDGIQASNRAHGQWAYRQLNRALQPLSGHTIGVLGLAYKPGTSTLRRSPSIELIQALLHDGARVQAFDPHVSALPDALKSVRLCPDARSVAAGADALVVGNESPEFRKLSADEVAAAMKGPRRPRSKPLPRRDACGRQAPVTHLRGACVMRLAGRTALVTGASLGLGAEIAECFAAEGAGLMLCARNGAELEAQHKRLAAAHPDVRIVAHRADVSVRADVDALFAATAKAFGKLDIVVNNAGIYGPMGSIDTIDWNEWVEAIAINLNGLVYCCRKAVQAFKPNHYGKIINLSGGGATNPLPASVPMRPRRRLSCASPKRWRSR